MVHCMQCTSGAREGPRRCSFVPELYELTVGPGETVRVVLASDGLWDVLPLKFVSYVVSKYDDPKVVTLSFHCEVYLINAGMDMDMDMDMMLTVDQLRHW